MKTETQTLRFVYSFSKGLACEFKIPDQCPQAGRFLKPTISWRGMPKHKNFGAYRIWLFFVFQTLADRWGNRILYALQADPNKVVIWGVTPGQAPHLEGAFTKGGTRK
jgi:hypothetical protein